MKYNYPNFEKLETIEVYIYYDRPLLFACQDILSQKYLALFVDVDEHDNETWIYVALSPRRFIMARSGGLDLFTTFGKPENGFVYCLKITQDHNEISIEILEESQIKPEWLPKPGVRLELKTDPLQKKEKLRAIQSFRESLYLKLDFKNFTRSEAPAHILGNVLVSFQDLLNSLTDSQAWMRVVGFNPGSFEIELEAEEQSNLFSESKTGSAIKEFINLISVEDYNNQINNLQHLNFKIKKNLASFLKNVTGIVSSTEFNWLSPKEGFGGKYKLESDRALSILEIARVQPNIKTKIFNITGTLKGIDLHTKHFRISIDEDISYSGYIDQDAINDSVIQSAQINLTYIGTIEEESIILSNKEVKLKYKLLKLDHYS